MTSNPYQAPVTPIGMPPIKTSRRTGPPFSSASTLAMVVKVLLLLCGLMAIVGVVSGYWQIDLLQRFLNGQDVPQAAANSNDQRQVLVGLAQLGLLLFTGIIYLIWKYRVHANLPSLQARKIEYSPGWAVGFYFIPIVNLFRPYQAMKEIWNGSDPKQLSASFNAGTALVGSWWLIYIVSSIVKNAGTRMAIGDVSVPQLISSSWVVLASNVLTVVAAILCFLVISNIDKFQTERNDLINGKASPYMATQVPQR